MPYGADCMLVVHTDLAMDQIHTMIHTPIPLHIVICTVSRYVLAQILGS